MSDRLIPDGYYLLRLPALPVGIAYRLLEHPDQELPKLWASGTLAEAVFVASPSLHAQITQHLDDKGWPLPASLLRPLLKYALRMSSRATPFGLMAGFSVGHLTDTTQVRLSAPDTRHQAHRRLDMALMARLVEHLANVPELRRELQFNTNNSLYQLGQEIRYVDCDRSTPDWQYFISATAHSTYLETVLQLAQQGATVPQLVAATTESGIDEETAQQFIDQLIEQRLLLSELEPVLTSPTILADLCAKLSQFTQSDAYLNTLRHVEQLLASDLSAYAVQEKVAEVLQAQFDIATDQQLIQTDLVVQTTTNQLNRRVVRAITNQVAELWPLHQASDTPLKAFAEQFRQRYDQREVPLSEALDGDIGIGYGDTSEGMAAYTPLLAGLTFPSVEAPPSITWGPYQQLLLKKFSQGLQQPGIPIELTPVELATLSTPDPPVAPASLYVFGNLLSSSEEVLDTEAFQFNLMAANGPSAATLLGRFCPHSAELTGLVEESLRREEAQHPDRIYAEIVHWPNDRAGNVLIRPALRTYEIPYNSPAAAAPEYQIPVGDLLVSVLPDGRVRLRSKRLGKEIIPRLSSAHNYRTGLSIYRFLADLQQQESLSIQWKWGPLSEQTYLPRITYKKLILSRASWLTPVAELPMQSAETLARYLRDTRQLPQYVSIAQADNELLIDLEQPVSQQLLFEEAKRLTTLRLTEWLAQPDQCWLHDSRDAYVQELILPCHRPVASSSSPPTAGTWVIVDEANVLTRSFLPGSEWLYVKLYTGAYSADELLIQVIWPVWQQLLQEDLIDQCFFIRYYDPEFHLRVRIHSHVPSFVGPALDRLNAALAPYVEAGVVFRVQTDTYEREIERYGLQTMGLSERLFSKDSQLILTYLSAEADPDERWLFALQRCHELLANFGLDLPEKVRLMQQLQAHFLAEHQADQSLRKQLNDQYRARQAQINACLDTGNDLLSLHAPLVEALAATIKTACHRQRQPTLVPLITSYIHMTLNRLFTAKHRAQELVIYHFLTRYYESKAARQSTKR